MKIIIDKSKFYVIVALLILFIGAFVYAGTVNSEFSGADSPDAFGHDIELSCVTGKNDGTGAVMISSTKEGLSGNDVIETAANPEGYKSSIKCREDKGWIRTGCSEETSEADSDLGMVPENGCSSGSNDDGAKTYITCCKIETS